MVRIVKVITTIIMIITMIMINPKTAQINQWIFCNEKFPNTDKTLPALEQSFKAANKLKRELPKNIMMGMFHLWNLHL